MKVNTTIFLYTCRHVLKKLLFLYITLCHEIWTLTGTFFIRNPLLDALSSFRRPGQPAARRGAHGSVRGPRAGRPPFRTSRDSLYELSSNEYFQEER